MSTQWIPIGKEFRRLRAEFADTYGEARNPSELASKAILDRLKNGYCRARTSHHLEERGGDCPEVGSYFRSDGEISEAFWERLASTDYNHKNIEWVTGDFSFKGCTVDFENGDFLSWWSAEVRGVEVQVASTDEEVALKAVGGRRPAKWWASFAEELAIYVHTFGPPAGTGTEGQEEVYKAICLQIGEENAPTRSTVLPIIGSVLSRIR